MTAERDRVAAALVVSLDVRSGCEIELEASALELVPDLGSTPAPHFLKLTRSREQAPRYKILATFQDEQALEEYLGSEAFEAVSRRLAPLLKSPPTVERLAPPSLPPLQG